MPALRDQKGALVGHDCGAVGLGSGSGNRNQALGGTRSRFPFGEDLRMRVERVADEDRIRQANFVKPQIHVS